MMNGLMLSRWRGWILAALLSLDALSIALALSIGTGNPTDATRLPLGDGKLSSAPQRGYVYACSQPMSNLGAFKDGRGFAAMQPLT